MQNALKAAFGTKATHADAFVADGMAGAELEQLGRLVRETDTIRALEVGMANGTSSVMIASALPEGGHLFSIDPFQTSDYNGRGMVAVRDAGCANRHTLLEEPDYLALPRLVSEGVRFDFIFIDGYHSMDYTMVDAFFADLLLKVGGVMAFHDTESPYVAPVVRFLEQHKPYTRLSPPLLVAGGTAMRRLWRRARTTVAPGARRDAQLRRTLWRTLSAYRKTADRIAPQWGHWTHEYVAPSG